MSGVQTDGVEYSSPMVIVAAGAWAGALAKQVGVDVPLQVWRQDIAYIKRPHGSRSTHPTVIDDANAMYFRPEGRELTLVALEDGNEIGWAVQVAGIDEWLAVSRRQVAAVREAIEAA